jgi:hypothetical protein
MKNKELKKVVDFYNNVILQQIILPLDINEILLLVDPQAPTMQPYMKKMRAITVYVQSLQAEVLTKLNELVNEDCADDECEGDDVIENDPRFKDKVIVAVNVSDTEIKAGEAVVIVDEVDAGIDKMEDDLNRVRGVSVEPTQLEILEAALAAIPDTEANKRKRQTQKMLITREKKNNDNTKTN